ncbi:hypothetical protein PIB30_053543 [Stylosanthes scabra]|uniref:Uncharacterized protein n=1 Tax=Stylosanthes scabra TaxID=79078 RepID=A0ABU6XGA7_9FABA|nr:hypothetical protein [Stylosanthes scabra]
MPLQKSTQQAYCKLELYNKLQFEGECYSILFRIVNSFLSFFSSFSSFLISSLQLVPSYNLRGMLSTIGLVMTVRKLACDHKSVRKYHSVVRIFLEEKLLNASQPF